MNFNAERDRKAEGMRAIKEGKMPDKLTQKTSKLRASRCAAVKENLHSKSSESFFWLYYLLSIASFPLL